MIFGRRTGKSRAASASANGFFTRRRRQLFIATGALVLTGAVAAAAIWGKNSPFYGRVQTAAAEFRDELAQTAGFTVSEILVVGRDATPRQALLDAVDVDFGDPILGVDLYAARERVMALPWVNTAAVERVLPNTLIVHLTERQPVALWQHHKQYTVIDREGHSLDSSASAAYPELLVIAGDDAPKHAAALIDMLRSEPELMARVDSAMWVGGRRWNIFLDNGISIRLPETEPAEAWRRLAEYQRMHALLSKNIRSIDMRIADKLILQSKGEQDTPPEGAAGPSPNGSTPGGAAPKAAPGKAILGKPTQGKVTQGGGSPAGGDRHV